MARKRMICCDVVNQDDFFDLSPSTQALYFFLNLAADDDGFISSPKAIIRKTNCRPKDLKELEQHGYIIIFESGVCAIRDWFIHNTLRTGRKKDTLCQHEFLQLGIYKGVYYRREELDNCQPIVSQMSAEKRIDEPSQEEFSQDEFSQDTIASQEMLDRLQIIGLSQIDYAKLVTYYKSNVVNAYINEVIYPHVQKGNKYQSVYATIEKFIKEDSAKGMLRGGF